MSQVSRLGFYTTRFVEAATPEEAELSALEMLRVDPALRVPAEHQTSEAAVLIEEVTEVPLSTNRKPNSGFTFYPMEA